MGRAEQELIDEKYRGIRPAFGYPACPDHSPKRDLFRILPASSIGIELTESGAMLPAASVSGTTRGGVKPRLRRGFTRRARAGRRTRGRSPAC